MHNVDAILAAFIPYHDSSHFARLAGLLSLSGKWSFLAGVARSSSPLPRSVLVRASVKDSSLLSFIVANGLTDASTPAASSLAAAVTLDLCAASPSLPENTVTLVLASALPCVRSVTRRETLAAALMCIAAVCGRAQVSAEVADTVTNTCVRRAVGGKTDSPFDADPLLAAIVVLCFKPLPSISRSRAPCKPTAPSPLIAPSSPLRYAASWLTRSSPDALFSFLQVTSSSVDTRYPTSFAVHAVSVPYLYSSPAHSCVLQQLHCANASGVAATTCRFCCRCTPRRCPISRPDVAQPPPLTNTSPFSVLRARSCGFLCIRHRQSRNSNCFGWSPSSFSRRRLCRHAPGLLFIGRIIFESEEIFENKRQPGFVHAG